MRRAGKASRKRCKWKRELAAMGKGLGLAAVLVYLLVTFVVQRADVFGRSMEPVLQDGDVLLVEKLTYRFLDPERFDIVVFSYGGGEDRYYTKRIVGLPGETVQIRDGLVYIDGQPLSGDVGQEPIRDPGRAAEPVVLEEDEYFVLGDNRNLSSDSRNFDVGNVTRDSIVGRIWFRVWPLGE